MLCLYPSCVADSLGTGWQRRTPWESDGTPGEVYRREGEEGKAAVRTHEIASGLLGLNRGGGFERSPGSSRNFRILGMPGVSMTRGFVAGAGSGSRVRAF